MVAKDGFRRMESAPVTARRRPLFAARTTRSLSYDRALQPKRPTWRAAAPYPGGYRPPRRRRTARRSKGCAINVDKAKIIAILRDRGLDARADWADRTLPDIVDTYLNAGLLQTLSIDVSSLVPAEDPTSAP